jgi:glutamyl-tRNA synthetase
MATSFEVTDVNPNPARFDQKKADAINAAHMRLLAAKDFEARIVPYLQSAGVLSAQPSEAELAILAAAAPLIQERIMVLSEAVGMLGFLFIGHAELKFDEDALAGLPANSPAILSAAITALEPLTKFETEEIQQALQSALIDGLGEKPRNAFGPLRVAISGRRVSPPLFESMQILGKQESLARLEAFASAH